MRQEFTGRLFLLGLFVAFAGVSAVAQTTIAVSGYGAFSGETNGGGTIQSPANAAGGMIEFRQIRNPLVGFEATYSFNRSNQEYKTTSPVSTGPFCPTNNSPCTFTMRGTASNIAHEITGDWVISMHVAKLRPFVLAGGGLLLNQPTSGSLTDTTCGVNTSNCQSSFLYSPTIPTTKGVFVYGAGLDWGLLPHLGLRLQYRGNLYKASQLITGANSSNAFTHTAEPMIGVYFRF